MRVNKSVFFINRKRDVFYKAIKVNTRLKRESGNREGGRGSSFAAVIVSVAYVDYFVRVID